MKFQYSEYINLNPSVAAVNFSKINNSYHLLDNNYESGTMLGAEFCVIFTSIL